MNKKLLRLMHQNTSKSFNDVDIKIEDVYDHKAGDCKRIDMSAYTLDGVECGCSLLIYKDTFNLLTLEDLAEYFTHIIEKRIQKQRGKKYEY